MINHNTSFLPVRQHIVDLRFSIRPCELIFDLVLITLVMYILSNDSYALVFIHYLHKSLSSLEATSDVHYHCIVYSCLCIVYSGYCIVYSEHFILYNE